MRKTGFIICLILFAVEGLKAQTDWNYNRLGWEPGFINPAYLGRSMDVTASILYRQQWQGVDGSPTSGAFDLHGGLKKSGLTLGVTGCFDEYNVVKQNLFCVSAGATVRLMHGVWMSAGLRLGIDMLSYDRGKMEGVMGDVFYAPSRQTFLAGAGFLIQVKKLKIGVAPMFDIGGDDNISSVYAHGEYDIRIKGEWNVHPMVMYRYHNIWESWFEGGVKGGMPAYFQVGVSYRSDKSLIVTGELSMLYGMSLSYSYCLHSGEVANLSKNSNEIGVTLNISKLMQGNRVGIRF